MYIRSGRRSSIRRNFPGTGPRLIALKDWHDRLRVAPLAIGWESPAHPPGGESASFELATS